MLFTSIAPIFAAIMFIVFALYIIFSIKTDKKNLWIFPAILSVVFLLFSLEAIISEGIFGFWTEHTHNLWGNQIWFDLLFATSISWFFAVPQAKSLGMRPLVWLIFIICTGSIGFLAMISRFLYLRQRFTSTS
jgi:hypothetical protein